MKLTSKDKFDRSASGTRCSGQDSTGGTYRLLRRAPSDVSFSPRLSPEAKTRSSIFNRLFGSPGL